MSSQHHTLILLSLIPLAGWAAACSEPHASPTAAQPPSDSAAAAAAAQSAAAAASAAPSGSSAAASDAGAPYDGPYIGATVQQAPIMSDMEWPTSEAKKGEGQKDARVQRLGYLRIGERAPVIAEPHKKSNCAEGWYELLAGGFVCGKYTTLDLEHPRFKGAKPPDLSTVLPYTYGVNALNGTPLYRQIPSHEERIRLEPWLVHPKKPKDDDSPSASTASAPTDSPDAGAAPAPLLGENAGDNPSQPWWQKDAPDAGPPAVSLSDLQEADGPIARRMVKGFFLSLDHMFYSGGASWWKTMSGLVTPADRIYATKPVTDYHGVWLGQEPGTWETKHEHSRKIDKLPVGWVTMFNAKRWVVDDSRKHASKGSSIDRFATLPLTGETASIGGQEYWETTDGWWLRAMDGTKTEPGAAPEKLGTDEKWIDVNLHRQTLVAFEGDKPVFATIVSSGRNEHETVTGSYRIREKHIASTMDGDADTATDGPYSIEDVPYIEYFSGGYALHGAFWHAEFGHIKSHGCVNLAPWDAKQVFGWTEPQLPAGWHAVFSTKEHPGTRVVVHEHGPGTCNGPKFDACH
jgi:hypothetical protein